MLAWINTQDGAFDQKTVGLLRYRALSNTVERNQYRVDWLDLLAESGKISIKNRRNVTIMWILQRFYVADQPAAEAWIEANPFGIDDEVLGRAHLLDSESRAKMETALGRAVGS